MRLWRRGQRVDQETWPEWRRSAWSKTSSGSRCFGCSFREFMEHGETIIQALSIEQDSYALLDNLLREFVRLAPDMAMGASTVIWDDVSYWVDLPDKSLTPTTLTVECVCRRPFYVGVGYYPWGIDVGDLRLWEDSPKRRYKSLETFDFPHQAQSTDAVVKTVVELCVRNIFPKASSDDEGKSS